MDNFNFTINVGGTVFSGIAQIDAMMNSLTADIDKQTSFWNKLNGTAFKFNNIIQSVKTVASSVIRTLDGFENAYNIQAQAEKKLEVIMRQRMAATEGDISSIKRLASEEQKLGIIGEEVQLSGAQQIATFVTHKSSLEALMPAMNNLLAQQRGINATSEDAVGIGNLMGKVMQGQTSALTRVGITFTEAEEKVLKYGNEQQRAAMLAQVITNNVGEMNAAIAATPEGALKQHANTMFGFQERIGKVYVDIKAALLPVFDILNEKIGVFINWLEANFQSISNVCTTVANVIGTAFSWAWAIVGGVIDVFSWLFKAIDTGAPIIAGLAATIGILAAIINFTTIKTVLMTAVTSAWTWIQGVAAGATQIWTGIQAAFNAVMSANPIGIVIALVAGLVIAITLCWQKFAGFRAVIKTVWDTVKGFGMILKEYVIDRVKGLIQGIGALGSAIGKLFKGDFKGAWQDAKEGVIKISGVEAMANAVGKTRELAGGVKGDYQQHLETERAKQTDKKKDTAQTAGATAALGGTPGGDDLPTPGSKSPIGSAIEGIGGKAASDNGGKIKNINIVIDSVVKNFTVATTNLKEDAGKIKQLVADALIGAVNDVNYATE